MILISAMKYHLLGPYAVQHPPEKFAKLDLYYPCKGKQEM